MACELATFLEQFPGETHVVLVHSEQWTEFHRAVMEALTEGVRMFLRTHTHLPFEKLLDEFKESQPRAVVRGGLQVSLLYGREGALYLDHNAKLHMDIKGLIFTKPWGAAHVQPLSVTTEIQAPDLETRTKVTGVSVR